MNDLVKYPATAQLANDAFAASGCKTHQAFVDQFGDAIGISTFRKWLGGSNPASPLAEFVLRQYIAGWRPVL